MRAKFKCDYITNYEWSKEASLTAVYSTKGENADFTSATPSGSLKIQIMNDAPASKFIEVGKYYYLDFTEAPKDL